MWYSSYERVAVDADENELDIYGNADQFVAVALTDAYPVTARATALWGAGSEEGVSFKRSAFRGRIIGANSPHEAFLPDPCDLSETANVRCAAALIIQHTEFLIAPGLAEEGLDSIEINDRVKVWLEPGTSNTPYNLQQGYAYAFADKGTRKEKEEGDLGCTTLAEIMAGAGSGDYKPEDICSRDPDAEHRTADDIYGAYGDSAFMTPELAEGIAAVGESVGIDPAYIANTIAAESSFNPKAISGKDPSGPPYNFEDAGCAKDEATRKFGDDYDRNDSDVIAYQVEKCATGLIQFINSTAVGHGTTTTELYGKSAVEQLPYVESYFAGVDWGEYPQITIWQKTFLPASLRPDMIAKYGEGVNFNIDEYGQNEKSEEWYRKFKVGNNQISYMGEYAANANAHSKLKC